MYVNAPDWNAKMDCRNDGDQHHACERATFHTIANVMELPVSRLNARYMDVRACVVRAKLCEQEARWGDRNKIPCRDWDAQSKLCIEDRAASFTMTDMAARPGFPANGGTNPASCTSERRSCAGASSTLPTMPSFCRGRACTAAPAGRYDYVTGGRGVGTGGGGVVPAPIPPEYHLRHEIVDGACPVMEQCTSEYDPVCVYDE